jgi:hypothetical protein
LLPAQEVACPGGVPAPGRGGVADDEAVLGEEPEAGLLEAGGGVGGAFVYVIR